MIAAGAAAGVEPHDPVFIEVPAGSCVFHAGEIWHGSGPNRTADKMRRSIGIHMIPIEAEFSDRPGGYIYRRYQRTDDPRLDESFFPVLWSESGGRTPWLDFYCKTGKRQNPRRRRRCASDLCSSRPTVLTFPTFTHDKGRHG